MRRPGFGTLVVAALLLLLSGPPAAAAETYAIDAVHSAALFKISHLGVSNFYGRFNGISGTYTWDAENPAASSVEVTVKTDSVDTFSEKRDQHLKSPDFFNAVQFPTLTLKSKSVKKTGDRTLRVTADLTLHGVTKEVAFDVTHVGAGKDPWGGQRSGFETQLTIKRADFGINFMPDALGADVTLIVSLEGVKK